MQEHLETLRISQRQSNAEFPCLATFFCLAKTLLVDTFHDAYMKTQKDSCLIWTIDVANSSNDPKCSEFYLINWLSSEEHYMRWRDPPGLLTKQKVCEEIVELLPQKGCRKQVDVATIYNKIQHIEGKMRQCSV